MDHGKTAEEEEKMDPIAAMSNGGGDVVRNRALASAVVVLFMYYKSDGLLNLSPLLIPSVLFVLGVIGVFYGVYVAKVIT